MMQEKLTQLDAIDAARIVHRARADWDPPGIVAAFAKLRYELDIAQALTAAMRAAADPQAKTPDAITWDKHRPATTLPGTQPGKRCADHSWLDASTCRCCWSEVKTGMRPESHIGRHYNPEAAHEAASFRFRGGSMSAVIICEHECKIYGHCYDRAACNAVQRCVSQESKETEA